MEKNARILVAGGDTLIGAAVLRRLSQRGYGPPCNARQAEPDLTDARAVDAYFARHRPEYVVYAGGRSGGIGGNLRWPAELMLDNLLAGTHVIHAAHRYGVRRLLYLASSCTYPRQAPQPLAVASVLTGPLEPTNEAYAVAKLAGWKLCEAFRKQYGDDFIVGVPANAFGPGDDFSLEDSHVIAALMRKMHEAQRRGDAEIEIWGTGAARREFIFADDLGDACVEVLDRYHGDEPINLGGGPVLSIREIAEAIQRVVGFTGTFRFDASRPDGMPVKCLDSGPLLSLGWRPRVTLDDALAATYQWYLGSLEHKEAPSQASVSETGEDLGTFLEAKAHWVRRETLRLHGLAPETRVASSLSDVEMFVALYYGGLLRVDPARPRWEDRDRFILSKGHGGVSLYPILADRGFFDRGLLDRICRDDSFLGGIPDMLVPGIETTNGSLGLGLGVGCGVAMALRMRRPECRVFVLVGDGELNEGSVWEAVMFAAHQRLANLVLIVDANGKSMLGACERILNLGPLEERFAAFDWEVRSVDGHDVRQVHAALAELKNGTGPRPGVLVAHTVKGKGVPSLESDELCHVRSLSAVQVAAALEEQV